MVILNIHHDEKAFLIGFQRFLLNKPATVKDDILFIGARFTEQTTFKYCSLVRASFNHAVLAGELHFFKVNLSRCTFQNTRIISSLNIEESRLDYANLKDIDIEYEAEMPYDDGAINLKGSSLFCAILPINLSDFFNIEEEDLCDASPVEYTYLPSGISYERKELIYSSQKLNEESMIDYGF